jgi:TonB family protein
LVKEPPHFPPELVQKYQHRQVVVSAIINKHGKFEQVAVKQSPNAQLNGPVLEALGKWVFWPAEVNGETVSVKTLLGIPVALPQ